jgi:hypothetical protein
MSTLMLRWKLPGGAVMANVVPPDVYMARVLPIMAGEEEEEVSADDTPERIST